jgi:hypothetical protein
MFTVTTKRGANLGSFSSFADAVGAVDAARIKSNDEARVKRDGALYARVFRLGGQTMATVKGDDTLI